jgi:hypothetical protein
MATMIFSEFASRYLRGCKKDVMFSFTSKYALALYELVQKRGNLKYKFSEEFPLEQFRVLLGVEAATYPNFKNVNQRIIVPAVREVNGLGEFGCKVEPIYRGRKVTAIRLSWWQKNLDEKKTTLRELRFSRVGRRARLSGTVETAIPAPPQIPSSERPAPVATILPARGRSGLKESQFGEEVVIMKEADLMGVIDNVEPRGFGQAA